MRRCLLLSIGLGLLMSAAASQAEQQTQSLDYEAYKTRVEPIFLAKRVGHARCYACRALGAGEGAPGHRVWLRINPGFGHGHSRKTNTGGEHSKRADPPDAMPHGSLVLKNVRRERNLRRSRTVSR